MASDWVIFGLGVLAVVSPIAATIVAQRDQQRREKVAFEREIERERLRQQHEIRRDREARSYEFSRQIYLDRREAGTQLLIGLTDVRSKAEAVMAAQTRLVEAETPTERSAAQEDVRKAVLLEEEAQASLGRALMSLAADDGAQRILELYSSMGDESNTDGHSYSFFLPRLPTVERRCCRIRGIIREATGPR